MAESQDVRTELNEIKEDGATLGQSPNDVTLEVTTNEMKETDEKKDGTKPGEASSDLPNEPPPSYNVIAKYKRKKRRSKKGEDDLESCENKQRQVIPGDDDGLGECCCYCCAGTCGLGAALVVTGLPIASIAIGAVYLDECPIEKYIPIYLIVGGVFFLVSLLNRYFDAGRVLLSDCEAEENKVITIIHWVLSIFLFAWQIAGMVWIFTNFTDVQYDSRSANDYCHPVCYKFAATCVCCTTALVALNSFCRFNKCYGGGDD